ncbi:uncharacterized protein LOC116348364 [Contarinia nasturtii]|uniref:uncharacterized protein LOC116348364 n=1 Tax=Contarinia nasturtii TaxID=265458 RepID=UPI0012D497B0|nr:uncharacterized protein LOC116348364 [Contarinia nasturtii]
MQSKSSHVVKSLNFIKQKKVKMITIVSSFLFVITFAIILNESFATGGVCFSSEEMNIDELEYDGEAVTFACVSDSSQIEFYMVEINGSVPSELIDMLDNGKGISFFFHGVGNEITFKNGAFYRFAEEWFNVSGNNICTVTYPFKKDPMTTFEWFRSLNNLVKSKRLDFAAKLARDIVLGVRDKCVQSEGRQCLRHMSQVDVSGFSFGAHMAGRACQYILEKTGERVRMLLALDPSKTPPFGAKIKNSIKRGHANYVQVIHTSSVVALWEQLGDIDIFVKQKTDSSFLDSIIEKHQLAVEIHMATATKRIYLIADENEKGNGTMVKREENESFIEPTPKANECLVGIYGTMGQRGKKGKKFTIRLKNSDISHIMADRPNNYNINFDIDEEMLNELMNNMNNQANRKE